MSARTALALAALLTVLAALMLSGCGGDDPAAKLAAAADACPKYATLSHDALTVRTGGAPCVFDELGTPASVQGRYFELPDGDETADGFAYSWQPGGVGPVLVVTEATE